MEVKLNSDKEE